MKKNIYSILSFGLIILIAINLQSCGVTKQPLNYNHTVMLNPVTNINNVKYSDLDYSVNVQVVDKRGIDGLCPTTMTMGKNNTRLVPSRTIDSYVSESISKSMNNMGFDVYRKNPNNYNLIITVNEMMRGYQGGVRPYISLNIEFEDYKKQVLYSTTVTTQGANITLANDIGNSLNKSLQDAFEKIDWNRIASLLKRAKKASQEKNKQVTGEGDTALEATIIRWYIVSSPAGADVQWRVVSSTPDVKNTNQNFLGSTPYESTESFDIMGLTYNNSGNVQIEVSCEKAGYITQRKRFNVRQAIDQKEISTKFNLIKEE